LTLESDSGSFSDKVVLADTVGITAGVFFIGVAPIIGFAFGTRVPAKSPRFEQLSGVKFFGVSSEFRFSEGFYLLLRGFTLVVRHFTVLSSSIFSSNSAIL